MNKLITATFASWKTTVVGILLAVDGILHAATALLDGDPMTNPDWNTVVALCVAALGLVFAKDADRGVKL